MSRKKSGCGIWMLLWIIIFLALLLILLENPKNFNKKGVQKKFDSFKNYLSEKIDKNGPVVKKNLPLLKETNTTVKTTTADSGKTVSLSKPGKEYYEIYLVKYVESQDRLKLVPVKRKKKNSDTPLSDSINLLLKGPTASEEKNKIISLFPVNTRFISAEVKDNIAYLNFNSEIETGVGISMLQARLYQIVYTATQFPNISGVIILINNSRKSTFSSEGLSLKRPLKRLTQEPIF